MWNTTPYNASWRKTCGCKLYIGEEHSNDDTDYKAKRFKNITLDTPVLHIARENLFYDWLKNKNKVGGQNKIPRLSNDRAFFEELLEIN